MSSAHRATVFLQECPTCGRRLRIRVEYLGKTIQCRHCNSDLTARDTESGTVSREGFDLMDRVAQLLSLDSPATSDRTISSGR